MMRISDFFGLRKKQTLKVLSVDNPYGDYYEIKLDSGGIDWTPGEHGSFSMPDKTIEGKKWRAFSVASIPSEGYVLIGTRTGQTVSSYKKALIALKPGETVSLRGPFGWFKVMDNKSPIVMFASGVGITPIRAIAKHLEHDRERELKIVYSSKDFYLFEEDLERLAENNDKIELIKVKNREETAKLIEQMSQHYGNEAFYYISGAMPVIKSIKEKLKEAGIKAKRMINDPFLGY